MNSFTDGVVVIIFANNLIYVTNILILSDQPFSFPSKNVIFGVEIMKFLIPGKNFSIFASPTKGMEIFLFEMSMK